MEAAVRPLFFIVAVTSLPLTSLRITDVTHLRSPPHFSFYLHFALRAAFFKMESPKRRNIAQGHQWTHTENIILFSGLPLYILPLCSFH